MDARQRLHSRQDWVILRRMDSRQDGTYCHRVFARKGQIVLSMETDALYELWGFGGHARTHG
jgi:hypothetical protein